MEQLQEAVPWRLTDLEHRMKSAEEELKAQHDRDNETCHKIDKLYDVFYLNGFRKEVTQIKRAMFAITAFMLVMFGDKVWTYLGKLI